MLCRMAAEWWRLEHPEDVTRGGELAGPLRHSSRAGLVAHQPYN
jgi:hypothetical protein